MLPERGSTQLASSLAGWPDGPQATGRPTMGRGMRNGQEGAQQVAADNRFHLGVGVKVGVKRFWDS